jgi:hypothetical protein
MSKIDMITLPLLTPVHQSRVNRLLSFTQESRLNDQWFVATICLAIMTSVAFWWYSFQHHWLLLYGDAHAHLNIARRVFDNTTPGLAQLGGVWLPLPQVLRLPLIWQDDLWRSGLAASFTSMPCFVLATIYIYLTAKRLTHERRAAFIGALAFSTNLNLLYLQTTPLSEPILITAITALIYYVLSWVRTEHMRYLIQAAIASFVVTLTRYDGWALFLGTLVLIGVISWRKSHSRQQTQGNMILFGALGGLGIVLWLFWDLVIFGDALYFERSGYSSRLQQQVLISSNLARQYHNLQFAIGDNVRVAAQNCGPILLALAALSLLLFAIRSRVSNEFLAIGISTIPILFNILSQYIGESTVFTFGAAPAQLRIESGIFCTLRGR